MRYSSKTKPTAILKKKNFIIFLMMVSLYAFFQPFWTWLCTHLTLVPLHAIALKSLHVLVHLVLYHIHILIWFGLCFKW